MLLGYKWTVHIIIICWYIGLTEDTGSEKPSTNNLDNNSTVKLSSNKRSHSHKRKKDHPTRARVASKRQSNNSFLGQTSEALNNNSDEDVVEVAQQPLTVNASPFSSLPSPAKRPFLLRPSNIPAHGAEGKINTSKTWTYRKLTKVITLGVM